MPKILFVGHGRAGKDLGCETLAAATGWKNAGTTSVYLTPYYVERKYPGLMPGSSGFKDACDFEYARRHTNREEWRRIGDEVRKDDPALLVKDAFKAGDISGGCRGLPEIEAVIREGIADLIVWVARPSEPPDPTMEFGPQFADIIIANIGTEAEYKLKVQRLGKLLGGFA